MLLRALITIGIGTMLLVGGCASVPIASSEQDAVAKAYVVPDGKASIYVYRHESMGAAIRMPVLLDGKWVGDTAAKTYMLLSVDPGSHTLISKTENDSVLYVTTESNKTYFVWQEVKMGVWTARSQLQLVDEQKGKKDVAGCRLVAGATH